MSAFVRLGPTHLRIVAAIQDRRDAGLAPPTVHELNSLCGYHRDNRTWIHQCLCRLRRLGILTWEAVPKHHGNQARTLRLLYRLELVHSSKGD